MGRPWTVRPPNCSILASHRYVVGTTVNCRWQCDLCGRKLYRQVRVIHAPMARRSDASSFDSVLAGVRVHRDGCPRCQVGRMVRWSESDDHDPDEWLGNVRTTERSRDPVGLAIDRLDGLLLLPDLRDMGVGDGVPGETGGEPRVDVLEVLAEATQGLDE